MSKKRGGCHGREDTAETVPVVAFADAAAAAAAAGAAVTLTHDGTRYCTFVSSTGDKHADTIIIFQHHCVYLDHLEEGIRTGGVNAAHNVRPFGAIQCVWKDTDDRERC